MRLPCGWQCHPPFDTLARQRRAKPHITLQPPLASIDAEIANEDQLQDVDQRRKIYQDATDRLHEESGRKFTIEWEKGVP